MHTNILTCKHIPQYIHTYTCIYTNICRMYTCTYMYKFTNKCKYRNINMYISIYTQKDIHKHPNIHTYAHKHTDGDLRNLLYICEIWLCQSTFPGVFLPWQTQGPISSWPP